MPVGPLEAAVDESARRGGTSGSAAAVLALALARRMDAGEDSGSALAALAGQLRPLLGVIEPDTGGGSRDLLDELKARREARGA